MKKIYYIGGSPCSGKSTIAEILSEKYHLYYFKVDDFLDKYMKAGAEKGCELCRKLEMMSQEEIWMRDPVLQCREEILIYKEIFEFVWNDLEQIKENDIITEGAAYLPELMKRCNVTKNRYLSMTPTADFQIFHYKQREWISYFLEGCKDQEKAFSNWMDRDLLFAQEVRKQCEQEQYVSVINDGSMKTEEYVSLAARHFGLDNH
mgnify:CR=1 FL=1